MLIFTDASFGYKPNMAGVGAIIIDQSKEYHIGAYTNNCRDNNIAEIAAIAFALKYVADNQISDKSKDKTLTVITDSSYAIQRINNKSPARSEFEDYCLKYISEFMKHTKLKVKFMQIKGHTHDNTKFSYFNNMADEIAGQYRYLGIHQYENKFAMNVINNKKFSR